MWEDKKYPGENKLKILPIIMYLQKTGGNGGLIRPGTARPSRSNKLLDVHVLSVQDLMVVSGYAFIGWNIGKSEGIVHSLAGFEI